MTKLSKQPSLRSMTLLSRLLLSGAEERESARAGSTLKQDVLRIAREQFDELVSLAELQIT